MIEYLRKLRVMISVACQIEDIIDKDDFSELDEYIKSAIPESYNMLGGRDNGDIKGIRSLMFVVFYCDVENIKDALPRRERGLA